MTEAQKVSILALRPPAAKERPKGFLEICAKAYSENVNSNVYAYFLDQGNDNGCSELFSQALLELINEKEAIQDRIGEFSLGSFDVYREFASEAGNRIDILLNDTESRKAIIIENKIYHVPINPFEDYWSALPYPDENKVGILLTLEEQSLDGMMGEFFINITHKQWVDKIRENGLPSGLDPKAYVYLNDFFNTIDDLTMNTQMNEQVTFYFENTAAIRAAADCERAAREYIYEQIATAAAELGGRASATNAHYRYIVFGQPMQHAYYTIILGDIFGTKPEVTIIIELWKNMIGKIDLLKSELEDRADYKKLTALSKQTKTYCHFLSETYPITEDNLKAFDSFLSSTITNDFGALMTQIRKHL